MSLTRGEAYGVLELPIGKRKLQFFIARFACTVAAIT